MKNGELQSPEYMGHGPAPAHALRKHGRPKRPVENLQVRAAAGDQGAAQELSAAPPAPAPTPPQNAPQGPPTSGAPDLPGVFNPAQQAPPLGWTTARDVAAVVNAPVPERPAERVPYFETLAEAMKLTVENVQGLIAQECDGLKALLLAKNRKYGNSALDPRRIFSKAGPVEQICVRIDDKLSRIAHTGFEAADEDTLQDLQGYITLLRVARRLKLV